MKHDIERLLKQEKGRDVFFTTMIDLYGIASDFPGWDQTNNLRHVPYERVQSLERALAADIADQRFVPYVQLHEFEAYLFSDPSQFGFFYDHHQKQLDVLVAIAERHESPELIDDGQHTAPSKRIITALPDYEDAKSVVGPQVAELIGLELIRAKCPHLAGWLSRLEGLAEEAQA